VSGRALGHGRCVVIPLDPVPLMPVANRPTNASWATACKSTERRPGSLDGCDRRRRNIGDKAMTWFYVLCTRASGWSILVRLLVGLVVFLPKGFKN